MEANTLPKRSGISANVLYPVDNKTKIFTLFRKVQGAMHKVPNFGDTCKAILDAVMEEMDAENCSLMLKDPNSGDLTVCAARGKDEEKSVFYLDRSGNGRRFKSGEGVAGWVLKEGQAVLLNDVVREPRFVSVAGLNNKSGENSGNNQVNSLICFPIREKDQVVGVFNLSHSKKGAFNEGDKLALGYISNQVGAALTSARFFLEINEVNRLMKDSREGLSKEKVVPIFSPSFSTFVEVGEVTREEGIFIYTSDKMQRI